MLIQQPATTTIGIVQDIPAKLLADTAIGQQLIASVVKQALAGELIAIKVANTSINIRIPVDMLAGQKLLLELVLEQGKPALKFISIQQGSKPIIPPGSLGKISAEITSLKVGQQITVQVVKILAENRLLLQTSLPTSSSQAKQAIQQFDVDTTQLSKNYKQGEKLTMNIVNIKPLSIELRPEKLLSREQLIVDHLRQLLPQSLASASLAKIVSAVNNQQLPASVQVAVQQLVGNTLDTSAVTQTNALKYALASSGVFTESQLLKLPSATNQDFKANVARVLNTLEGVIAQVQTQLGDKPINQLPAQVQSALSSQGKSPAHLLSVLLSGKNPTSSSVVQTVLSTITSQEQAAALIQLLTKSLSTQSQGLMTSNRQTPLELSELMTLFKDVDSVHKKLQYNQLSMLKEPESGNIVASWLFDLPIKDKQNVDLLQMQIDQQKKKAEENEESWQVQLHLDTQNLGPVQANVTLHGEDVKVMIRAKRAESAQLLEQNLPLLSISLEKLNVVVSHMSCVCEDVNMIIINNNIQQDPTSFVDVSV